MPIIECPLRLCFHCHRVKRLLAEQARRVFLQRQLQRRPGSLPRSALCGSCGPMGYGVARNGVIVASSFGESVAIACCVLRERSIFKCDGLNPLYSWRIAAMRPLEIMYPFPVRILDGFWHVLMNNPRRWIKCDTRHDARNLARSQVLINQAACSRRKGIRFTAELAAAADVLDRYKIAVGAKLCRYYANCHSGALQSEAIRRRRPR
jgi:hypothetical protein